MAESPAFTKRLYFEDAYRTDFEAKIVARTAWEDRPAVVLDRTCFYPESGSQPWDTGTINGIPVLKVLEEGETIFHVLERDPDPAVQPGSSVAGRAAGPIIKEIFKERTPEEARLLALSLIKQGHFVVLFGASGPERDHIILARSDDLPIDLREVGQAVAPLVGGRRGGRPFLVEIVIDQRGKIEEALEHAVKHVQERL
jgi:alanyl-tRNA synthetase